MNAHEQLRHAIDEHQDLLRASVPSSREPAILALLRVNDRLSPDIPLEPHFDLVTGRRLAGLGGNKALQLLLESESTAPDAGSWPVHAGLEPEAWAERFLQECACLAEAELVCAHSETGFMRLVDDGHGTFSAWIATRRRPTSWRERADIDWWATSLARSHPPEPATANLGMMAWQLPYPPDAVIGGCTIHVYRDILAWLIAWVQDMFHGNESLAPQSEDALVAAIARDLAVEPTIVRDALAAFTLDRDGAAWHAAVPGIAAAPLVLVAPGRLVPSIRGLTSEPLLFLLRELRRRDPQAYHNVAHHREDAFRQDLYALFEDKRFVSSRGRIELRRDGGTIRTDIDAAVFDRKTGTLALFELKSQDPFARSPAEQARQRDNVLFANHQVSAVLDWLKRNGANELLQRIDSRTARSFRVHRVCPFVLGRYLARFSDGPAPDPRAAWGTWPQLLRLLDRRPIHPAEANPIVSLHGRLAKDDPASNLPTGTPPREIAIGSSRLVVHPSWAALQMRPDTEPT